MNLARRCATVVVAVALAGCGGGKDNPRRDAVNAYIDRVDRAQAGLIASQGQIDQAFRKFKLTGNNAAEVHELTFARDRVEAALKGVRKVRPPADARKLHHDLVALLTLQRNAAAELLQLVVYDPQLKRALVPLSGAGKKLASDLRSAAKTSTTTAFTSAEQKGAGVWASAGCGTCHTLAAARAAGTKGPDLDVLRLSPAEVAAKVRAGGTGMPAYAKRLRAAEIDALAAFVSAAEAHATANTTAIDAYAAAFGAYRQALDGIVAALRRLRPPPVLRPTYEAELRTLGHAATLSGEVSAALGRRDVAAANKAIRQLFDTAASAAQSTTQRAAAAAVVAYNGRLKRIATLSARIARERQRLVQTVG